MKLSKSTRERLTAWWEHRPTGRPCILATSPCGDPGPAPAPDDYWTKPELLADCVLARQRAVRFWGEALPFLYMDYGAPAMALQMGAKASWTSIETLWADPCVETADEVAALRPGGYWKEIQDRAIREGISRCGGSAMLASYCLGASADTTAALMGSENLLCALIEDEEGVKRAFEAVKRIMIDAFSALAAQCEQGGTQLTGWHGIWSPGATTAIQEDFSYMIGSDMFDEFCLPHIRDMVDAGVPVAVATDFNPGSCPGSSLQLAMNIACLKYRMTPEEVLTAVTLNAAAAIGRAGTIGSVEPGKQADLLLWNAPDLDYVCYRFGSNLVGTVMKKGRIVHEE